MSGEPLCGETVRARIAALCAPAPLAVPSRAEAGRLLSLAPLADERIHALAGATDPVEVDLEVLRLRDLLSQADLLASGHAGAGVRLDAADLAWAPALWQLHVLDRDADAWLLPGLPHLSRWAARLAAIPAISTVLTGAEAARWLAALRRRGAFIAQPRPAMAALLNASSGAVARP